MLDRACYWHYMRVVLLAKLFFPIGPIGKGLEGMLVFGLPCKYWCDSCLPMEQMQYSNG